MKCKEVKNLISPYLDGEVPEPVKQELELHFNSCRFCQEHYEEMSQISGLFNSLGEEIIPAPPGFKEQLMLRINEKHSAARPLSLGNLTIYWKKTVAAAAAVAVIALAGFNFVLPWGLQIAHNLEKSGVDNPAADIIPAQNSQPNPLPEPDDNNSTTKPGGQVETNNPDHNPTVDPIDRPTTPSKPESAVNEPVLLNAGQQNIKTTLLKVAVLDNIDSPTSMAANITRDMGGQSENLGQQVKDNVTYTQMKLTIPRDTESSLINKLSSLGTIYSKEEDYKDISSAYTHTLNEYYNLSSQKSGADDEAELEAINNELNILYDKLGAFKQQAEKITIVLWLQQ